VRRPRLLVGIRLEGISEDRPCLRDRAADRPAGIGPTAATDFHAVHQSRGDINITEEQAGSLVGADVVAQVRDYSLRIYGRGLAHAESKGIILADTKFEFGLVAEAEGRASIILIDEVLTPDSSRFWPMDQYKPGGAQPSFDKQYVRDYLEAICWNKQPPAPALPSDVVARTREKYVDAFRRLPGRELQ
jgi:phosphoribosylaminoimidazole-succinocarboxamide synthase